MKNNKQLTNGRSRDRASTAYDFQIKTNIKKETMFFKEMSFIVTAEFSYFRIQLLLSFVPWTFVVILHIFAIFAHDLKRMVAVK